MSDPQPAPRSNETSFLRRLVVATQPALTRIAHGSAPFITVFALIHLTAPVMANLAGASLASQTMLLGREYYQTSFGEKYLVIAPLIIHPLSATLKRVLSPKTARRVTSILSVTGYSAVFCVLVHYFLHRVAPSSPASPIYSVGPSELDFEYVKYGLHEWPVRNFLAYTALAALVCAHASEGMSIIWNTWMRPTFGALRQSRKARLTGALLGVVPVVLGLFFMWSEPLLVFASHAERFRASFMKSVFFRF